jgi:hypothetical protein
MDSIMHSINSSRLSLLFLNSNAPTPAGIEALFSSLDAPHLHTLHLSRCDITYPDAKHIAAFLASPRSRNLLELQLNANSLGYEGVKELVDVVQTQNYSIEELGLAANDPAPAKRRDSFGDVVQGAESDHEPDEPAQRAAELERLSGLLRRNRSYTRRVQQAAARCIAPARILLNAKPPPEPSALEIAHQIIADVSRRDTDLTLLPRSFPFLDLPIEIQYQIVRHTSHDPLALSDGQFARLRSEAQDREALRRMADIMDRATRRDNERDAVRKVRDEWLKRGRWDKWECNA